jgi:hypothetical protein
VGKDEVARKESGILKERAVGRIRGKCESMSRGRETRTYECGRLKA